jgi:hypothetical protein
MTPAERQARIRSLKRELRTWGSTLAYCKELSRGAVYQGKHDRKRPAFRRYEEKKFAYAHAREEFDALARELEHLRQAERKHAARAARRRARSIITQGLEPPR